MSTLLNQVQSILVEMTRYPPELFTPKADFEDELGIDSVKLAEIYAELQLRFDIDKQVVLQADKVRNLEDLIQFLQSQQSSNGVKSTEPPTVAKVITRLAGNMNQPNQLFTNTWVQGADPSATPLSEPDQATRPTKTGSKIPEQHIIAALAEVTRYPKELFAWDAHLEDDLGIDSVKQAEIFAVLAQRFHLDKLSNQAFDEISTVGAVITSIQATAVDQQNPTANIPPTKKLPSPPQAILFPQNSTFKPLQGKIAFITGSGHGIGAQIAQQLASLGADVIVNSFHSRHRGEATVEKIRGQGGTAFHLWGSVAKQDHLERMFRHIEDEWGGLDFFIHNASNGLIAPLTAIQNEHWEKAFRTNVVGLHQGALMAAKLMEKRGGGKIIAMSSPGAQRTIEHFGCMGPVKAAVESLVRYLAMAFKEKHIAVNAVSAGPVQGELLQKYPDATTLIPQWQQLTLGTELIRAEDVAHAVLYLLSPLASKISGSVHLVDGTIALSL